MKLRLQALGIAALTWFGLFALPASAAPLDVVASFSILADICEHIGGDRIQVHSLVGRDADAHMFAPTPADARTIAGARLVVVNGLGFEGWIDRLVKSSGYRGPIVVATNGIDALGSGNTHVYGHGSKDDPHAWQDPANVRQYVDNIARALTAVDPDGKADYLANAERFKAEISALDAEIRRSFATIPAARRKVVTTHDAFAYFGRAYALTFIAPVGVYTDAEPSAADIGNIIRQIRHEKIPAVFMETISDPRLLERISQESGARIGGALYSDSLSSADGPAPTYLDMMRHNARTLAEALAE
ncbi:MAG: metal ABC transporter substrate-binding protein [Propionivibrio sp.]